MTQQQPEDVFNSLCKSDEAALRADQYFKLVRMSRVGEGFKNLPKATAEVCVWFGSIKCVSDDHLHRHALKYEGPSQRRPANIQHPQECSADIWSPRLGFYGVCRRRAQTSEQNLAA